MLKMLRAQNVCVLKIEIIMRGSEPQSEKQQRNLVHLILTCCTPCRVLNHASAWRHIAYRIKNAGYSAWSASYRLSKLRAQELGGGISPIACKVAAYRFDTPEVRKFFLFWQSLAIMWIVYSTLSKITPRCVFFVNMLFPRRIILHLKPQRALFVCVFSTTHF